MSALISRREELTMQIPLCMVPSHYAGVNSSPFLLQYLTTVLRLCPRGGRTCETGISNGYGATWLSQRGILAEGLDPSAMIVERARAVNSVVTGKAEFHVGDVLNFYEKNAPRYHVIHHQGVLEHFTAPVVRSILAQQVASADHVVFSVPSVFYPFDPEFGDERLLPLDEWRHLLAGFDIKELNYYGDPKLGGQEQILCVLRGQAVDDDLLARMEVGPEPYPDGVSAIVHTRNEARHIGPCLETLKPWVDEIIVCDMESEDATVEIARQFTDKIIAHPRLLNFDRARNVSAMRAAYKWIFYLDADERVPEGLGTQLRQMIAEHGDQFEASLIPFRHFFAGHWMQSLYPGYTAPRLIRNGKFLFNARLHSGVIVDGRTTRFPADDPNLALTHYSYDSLAHYLEKMNRYTDGEAADMQRDGRPFHWTNAVAHFVQDFQNYWERGGAQKDDIHGFIWSFFSAFYRFAQHAKLYEHRYRNGETQPEEKAIPRNTEQMLEFALQVARQKPRRMAADVSLALDGAPVVWSGPLLDRSGYGEESRHLLFALQEAAQRVTALPILWNDDDAGLSEADRKRLYDLCETSTAPGFVQIVHNFPPLFQRHPQAGVVIGRTTFETDRLPQDWVQACNRMDYVWVPSEFNKQTFAQAGVDAKKLMVVPECLDPAPYLAEPAGEPPHVVRDLKEAGKFVFLTVFDWTLHKGWDVLLRAFLEEFEDRTDVALVFKVWSSNGYSPEQIYQQAADFAKGELNHDITLDPRIVFVRNRLSDDSLHALYCNSDCYVMPSRGEGWGRPYMEAMACGLAVIGTNWSGNTAFMTPDTSYLIDCTLQPVPEAGWREVQTYRGHRWAEPDTEHLKQFMRHVFENREEAAAVGQRAKEHILANFSRAAVGPQIVQALERIRDEQAARPALTQEAVPENGVVHVRWEGAQWMWHSLAHVNREFCLGLLGAGMDLSLIPTEPDQFAPSDQPRYAALGPHCFAALSSPADVHVRHHFPPRFDKPCEGHLVLIQPWEYGYLPAQWIEPIRENVSEVWCHSKYVMDVYKNSGVPNDRLQLVPLGVDTAVFNPSAPPYVFTTEAGTSALYTDGGKPFVFLYVGGTIHRKGADILLDAYLRAFSAADDVALIVKDTGTGTVYRDDNMGGRIKELIADPTRPRIIYLDNDLSAHQLAGIYTAADCIVQPYRGEGFCLPVLEAMACGVPAIVPDGGSTDDFVDAEVGWGIAAARKPFGDGKIGPWECVQQPWMFEVDAGNLASLMRKVRANPDETRRRGETAAERVAAHWTWEHACAIALKRLKALKKKPARKPGAVHPLLAEASVTARDASAKVPSFSTRATEFSPPFAGVEAKGARKRGTKKSKAQAPPAVVERLTRADNMPTISLCMIVKDEERVLGDCLESIKPYVDEMIVVDTGSTDRTVQIAEVKGARVYVFPWTNSFSEARNESLKYATGDWVLWMDADDTIPPECGAKLREKAFLAPDRTTAFLMQVHIPPGPGETGFTIVDHVKLFRNGLGLRFEGRIHEQILEPIYRIGGEVERTNLFVVHSGYDYSPEGQTKKRARDLLLLEKDLAERPDHPFVLFNIGMTAHHLKDYDQAISALERCLALSKPHESTLRKVYAMLAGSHLEKGERERAKERVEQGLRLFPRDPELLFRAGGIYREVGDFEAAVRSYRLLLCEAETGHIDSLDVSMTGFKAHHNLALTLQDMGRHEDALPHWQEAVRLEPGFVPSWVALADLYMRLGRQQEAQVVAMKLQTLQPPAPST